MTETVPSGIDGIRLLPGSHVCAFYRGDHDRDWLLHRYLSAGLAARDKCICVVDSAFTAKRLQSLTRASSEADYSTGQLDIHLPQVLVQGILVENPYYVGPDEFLRSTRM